MKILYVTTLWTALKDLLFLSDGENAKGQPAFIKPLRALIKRGDQVDFIIIYSEHEETALLNGTTSFKTNLISRESVKACIKFIPQSRFKKFIPLWKVTKEVERETEKLLSGEKYDFVYAHGSYATGALRIANKYGVSCGQRQYGTELWDVYKKRGLLRAICLDPLGVWSFRLKKSFDLMTDDGTGGDRAQKLFSPKKPPYNFCFWVNGVDDYPVNEEYCREVADRFEVKTPALFYCARIVRWKRQDRAVKIAALLKEKNIKAHVYFAGQCAESSLDYLEELKTLAAELGVADQMHYIDALSAEEISAMAKLCDASLSFYDMSNLGNVFHELLRYGAVIVGADDGSLDRFIKHGENGFLAKDDAHAAEIISQLLESDSSAIRAAAVRTSNACMKSWPERISAELDLIDNAVNSKK